MADVVGWVAGPTERGTLSLVWSCLITIFACTWTVLHLNVPGYYDKPRTIVLRKLKWMVINMLFPEFILSKAICDLRLALHELLEFDAYLREHKKDMTWTIEHHSGLEVYGIEWSWKVETLSGWSSVLFDIFRLPRTLPLHQQRHEHQPENDLEKGTTIQDRHAVGTKSQIAPSQEAATGLSNLQDDSMPCTWALREQTWTITHSYYARMGGLVAFTCRYMGTSPQLELVTPSKLTPPEPDPKDEHPLRYLILGKEDIEDKSKADWFLKTLAILEVAWLVLNVIVRYATGLPITQLEVATVAFAIMAVFSYLANWWKPKDVSRPTVLQWRGQQGKEHSHSIRGHPHMQSFMQRLRAPAKAVDHGMYWEVFGQRIGNDVVWLERKTPLLCYLMAGSSLIFGGLHCLAWDFEFPTRVELICWRVASVTSAVLPVVTLAICAFLGYLATSYLGKQFKSKWLADLKYKFGNQPHSIWWQLFLNPQSLSSSWDEASLFDLYLRPAESRNGEKPSPPGNAYIRVAFGWEDHTFTQFEDYLSEFRTDLSFCMAGTATTWQWAWLSGELSFMDTGESIPFQHPQLLEFWRDYENFARCKLGHLKLHDACGETETCLGEVIKVTKNNATWAVIFEKRFRRASNAVFIMSLVLYAASRLIILVILFTSLRAAPAGVYQNTVWTRFLPSFS